MANQFRTVIWKKEVSQFTALTEHTVTVRLLYLIVLYLTEVTVTSRVRCCVYQQRNFLQSICIGNYLKAKLNEEPHFATADIKLNFQFNWNCFDNVQEFMRIL